VEILLSNAGSIAAECRAVLGGVEHDSLAVQIPLALAAIDAWEAGHREAALALAVVVTETGVTRVLGGTYTQVKEQVLFYPEFVPFTELRIRAALAPIGSFYTPWFASSGTPPPEALSRHVAVHQADAGHYTPGNAIVAILLLTSVLRALQELQELVETSGT
jgi:hypothetical protein